jgi:predicted  nucleic acid-binding Zn-ribbon protein
MKKLEDSKEDIAELKKKETDAKKKLSAIGESVTPLVESVSEKFARLRPNL